MIPFEEVALQIRDRSGAIAREISDLSVSEFVSSIANCIPAIQTTLGRVICSLVDFYRCRGEDSRRR